MEKRVKALYIITIIAILSFLGMQGYWLYGRYGFSLREYEDGLSKRIVKSVEEYNEIRDKASDKGEQDSLSRLNTDRTLTVPTFTLKNKSGDSISASRTSTIKTYHYSAHDLLGLPQGKKLPEE